jgi:peptide/nickel transport system permease protein
VLSLLLLSTPVFVIATLLTLAATRVNSILGVQLFEYIGETSSSPVTGWWNQFVDRLQHLVLPSFTLALLGAAGYSRYQRNAMLDVLGQDFIRTARAKGLSRLAALRRHGLRNAAIPVVTVLGLQLTALLVGAVVIENVFTLPGLGKQLVDGINSRETVLVLDIVMLLVFVALVVNLAVDLLYLVIDPRLRTARR